MFEMTKILPVFCYPVGLTVLLLLLCLFTLLFKWGRSALLLLLLALTVLGASSVPAASHWLVRSLEKRYPPAVDFPKVSAIVLLGGGQVAPVAPRLYPEVNDAGDRIIHAARLYHKGRAPYIIAAGGKDPFGRYDGTAAQVNADILAASLSVPRSAILLEDRSRNTAEHGPNVRAILESRKLPLDIIVVTSAMHMPRAVMVFERHGFRVHPAPTDFLADSEFDPTIMDYLPQAGTLERTTQALHEYYGMFTYSILDRI